MAITATVSSKELLSIIKSRHRTFGQWFSAALVNTSNSYVPGSTITYEWLANEIPLGTAGYQRTRFQYLNDDIGIFADDGIPLARKAVTFNHDNSSVAYDFTHVVLLRSIRLWGSIFGATVTVETEFPLTGSPSPELNELGIGMAITGAGLPQGLGITADQTGGGGPGAYTINQNISPLIDYREMFADEIIAVAPLSSTATMADNSEAVFYWDLKYFNYYQV